MSAPQHTPGPMKVKSLNDLNKAARKFLLENCVSKKAAPCFVSGFTGYINSDHFSGAYLLREGGKWRINGNTVLSINGSVEGFVMHKKATE